MSAAGEPHRPHRPHRLVRRLRITSSTAPPPTSSTPSAIAPADTAEPVPASGGAVTFSVVTTTVTEVTTGGIEVSIADGAIKGFIRKGDLSRDRQEQRPERFAVGDKVDALVTAFDKAARKVSLSIKAMEIRDEKEAVEQYGSADSGASLGDILGAALKGAAKKED